MVDDNHTALTVHKAIVSRFGHGVVPFDSPVDAMHFFEDEYESIDLIITDYRMPEMNGLQLLQNIQALGINIPAIILTGYPDEVDGAGAELCGAHILGKPIRINCLIEQISSLSSGTCLA